MNKQLETKHLAVIAAMLIAFGTQLGGLEHGWHDALTPQFVSGTLISIGTTLAALFVGAPRGPWNGDERRKEDPDGRPF